MSKHIGIVGCSAEGAALCYRLICSEAPRIMGSHTHPEITMHTHPLKKYLHYIEKDDWDGVAELMLSSSKVLEKAGADFIICPDNTIHQAYDLMITASSLPWIHIADVVSKEAKQNQFHQCLITGTKYLTTSSVYPVHLKKQNISYKIPDLQDRNKIDQIIFTELTYGVISEQSEKKINTIIQKFKNMNCDAVILGCTELPLLIKQYDCPLPILDSTGILASAAIEEALKEE